MKKSIRKAIKIPRNPKEIEQCLQQPSFDYRMPLKKLEKAIASSKDSRTFKMGWIYGQGTRELARPQSRQVFHKDPMVCAPDLSHGLDRAVDNRGVHVLKNFESDEYHFPRWLEQIHHPTEIAYDAMVPFAPPSQDPKLKAVAEDNHCKYRGSTSSLTNALIPLALAISNRKFSHGNLLPSFRESKQMPPGASVYRKLHMIRLRKDPVKQEVERGQPRKFGEAYKSQRFQASAATYSIDGEKNKSLPSNFILLKLGHQLERFLCMPEIEFKDRFMKDRLIDPDWRESEEQSYHYLKCGKILGRSQIDCKAEQLKSHRSPSGTFDLKTRAIAPIRFNISKYLDHLNSPITSFLGKTDSFEKEFYDMTRSAFYKYVFQAKIGQMDGMFMAYHNTQSMYGFEYIPLDEMNTYTWGSDFIADELFHYSFKALEKILDKAVQDFPDDEEIRIGFTLIPSQKVTGLRIYFDPQESEEWSEDYILDSDAYLGDNPFNVSDRCKGYQIGFAVERNGESLDGPIYARPGDDLRVKYTMNQMRSGQDHFANKMKEDVLKFGDNIVSKQSAELYWQFKRDQL